MIQSGFRLLTSDGAIDYRHLLITNILVRGNAADLTVTLYDGQDVDSGIKIHTLTTNVTGTNQFQFLSPFPVERGLYVDFGSNITEVTVFFMVIPDENWPEYALHVIGGSS